MTRLRPGALGLRYALAGDIEALAVDLDRPAVRTDGLWRHTCFEAFVAAEGPEYVELNFAPSGAWAAYRFVRYREGMQPLEVPAAPRVRLERGGGTLALEVECALPAPLATRARLALAAVIEERSGVRSYWALAHPAREPDFHHPDGFVLLA